MYYAAKPFGKAGRTDDALIDRILNSCLIADCVSCIQNLSSSISIIVELSSMASYHRSGNTPKFILIN